MSLSEKIAAVVAAIGAELKSKADAADLATVATSGSYGDLSGLPTLGTAAATDAGAYATAAQGSKADSAVQPGDLTAIQSELDTKLDQAAVDARVGVGTAALVDQAPATLDTLNELAAALGDDPNFATTVANQIGTKVDKTISITASTGLSGGGNLSASRSLSVNFGTAAGTACAGNDARLSNARTPTAHTHNASDIDSGTLDGARLPGQVAIGKTGTGSGASTPVTIWYGTAAEYASATKYTDRIYFCT